MIQDNQVGENSKNTYSLNKNNNFKNHKRYWFLIVFLLILLGGVSVAYQSYEQQIPQCSVAAGDICFDLESVSGTDNAKFDIKNLSDDKKYRFILRRKINSDEVIEVGSMVVDMGEFRKVVDGESCLDYRKSTDIADAVCCGKYEKKIDQTDSNISVCCNKNECAANGTCFVDAAVVDDRKCNNGNWN